MAANPYVPLSFSLKIGTSSGDAVEVNEWITGITLEGTRSELEVPATAATGEPSVRLGSEVWTATISFLDDLAVDALQKKLFDAFSSTTGQLWLEGYQFDGAQSSTNPKYAGFFLVSSWKLGGPVGGQVLTQDRTFRMTAAPTISWGDPPTAPTNFAVGVETSTTIPVTWTDSTGETGYELAFARASADPFDPDSWTLFSSPAAGSTAATITGLTSSTFYSVRLRAVNSSGSSDWVYAGGVTTA